MICFSRDDTKVIKGLAIILMLYHHLFGFPDRIAEDIAYFSTFNALGTTSAYLLANFGQLCVSIFLLLGGYGTFISCSKGKKLFQTLLRKIIALYIAYWKVFVVFIPICIALQVPNVAVNLAALIGNFTGLRITYCGEWWFFTTYVALMVLYPVIHLLLEKSKRWYCVDCGMLIILFLFARYFLPEFNDRVENVGSWIWNINYKVFTYLPVFFVGCIMAKYDIFSKIRNKLTNVYICCAVSMLALLVVFVCRLSTGNVYDCFYTPAFVVASYVLLSMPVFRFPYKVLLKIGTESTTIWLVHSVYCYLLCQRFVFMPRYTVLIFLWLLVLSYTTSVVLKNLYMYLMRAVRHVRKNRLAYAQTNKER